MRVVLTGLAFALLAGSAAAQSSAGSPEPVPAPSLVAGMPAYDISTFGDLVRLCTTDRGDSTFQTAMGLCAGYISGVLDYHLVDTGWTGGRRNRRVCLPTDRPTRLETIQSLVAWNGGNPHFNSEPAADGVMRYFMTTYPCSGAPSGLPTARLSR